MRFQAMSAEQFKEEKLYRQWGLTDAEYDRIEAILGRLPNYTEAGIFSVMWSEHCSYKNTKPVLKQFFTQADHVLQGPGEGAGIVDIGDNQAVVFKMESHNHPSAVEPYEGAATGVGGIIRDILSMGARPIALMDSLRFGELDNTRTKYIFSGVVDGIGGYGNCIGVPTVGGETKFDPCYECNPLVNVMCVGLVNHENIQKGQAKGIGNAIVYVGAKTGRDGIHGATFASEEFSDENSGQKSAIQVGDPFTGKLLIEACLDLVANHRDILVGMQDMGAAGLVSSSSEMASKAHSGIELYLDLVPQRETEMTPYEILLSESQERMLICVQAGHEKEVEQLFERYDLHAVTIGKVVEGNRYRVFQRNVLVADIPVDAIAKDTPVYHNKSQRPERIARFGRMENYVPRVSDVKKTLFDLLTTADLASKAPIYQTYDSMVRTSTVVGPGSDAAVVRVRGTKKALAMTTDCNGRYVYLDPYIGGQIAVSQAARNITASGGYPLAITNCLNYGNPQKPEVYYELIESAKGIAQACRQFNVPVISGNVSLYNESQSGAVYPTPTIGMVGLIDDTDFILTQYAKTAGDNIYLVGDTGDDFGGSLIQKHLEGNIFGTLRFNMEREVQTQKMIYQANRCGFLNAAHDVSQGGVLPALMQMVLETPLGFSVALNVSNAQLFSESQSRFIITVPKHKQVAFDAWIQTQSISYHYLGEMTSDGVISIKTVESTTTFNRQEIQIRWKQAIPCLLKQDQHMMKK